MTKTIIYSCVFFNEKYINLINLLLKSYKLFGNSSGDVDYLIICNPDFQKKIQAIFDNLNISGKIWCIDLKTKFEAGYSRLKIFDYPDINLYNKILYLDCDILVTNSINKILDFQLEDKLYALKEGNTNHVFWGNQFFDNNPYCAAFTSGILLFNNNIIIKDLFSQILLHIHNHITSMLPIPGCLDQPFIIYHAVKNNLYNNQKLINIVINNPNNFNNETISHFPGVPGHYESKIVKMTNYMRDIMFNVTNKEVIPEINLINKSQEPCKKNTIFPLIGICISYKYMDTLKFMLPINYNHFDKLYLVTQEDDVETIEFCKNFTNVVVLFYNFKKNNKIFYKFGSLNMVQKIVYEKYPKHWYLIIDSDIILPNNFIDILKKEKLNEECIYGAIRNNYEKSSELLNQIIPEHDWKYNNINHPKSIKTKPSIMGCFQLYKKCNIYHKKNFNDAGWGDFYFCWDNFDLSCNLENLVYLHLGLGAKNWKGKVEYFNDDCNINLNQIYFNCNIKYTNTYYDENKNILNLMKNTKSNSINIYDNIWTCSHEFREDIKYFFKDKSHYKIAEIGSHKGYTTGYLSNIFEKVYAVDNSVQWTNFNKKLNKDKNNIEYVHLDIYKNSWHIIPDVDVVFIDAGHSYKCCKSDMYNSIRNFKNLKYIIFDDYGVWPGVKQIVNESLTNKILIFENYIGLNNVPGPNNKVVKNTSEGIICGVNQLLNKTYIWENSNIEFLENGKMNAFGAGKYSFIDKYLVKCDFGGREHLLKFNENYSRFISVRKDDFEVVLGDHL
jgi:hypothetical protein